MSVEVHKRVCVCVWTCTYHSQGGRAGPVVGLDLGGQVGVGRLSRRELGRLDDQILDMFPLRDLRGRHIWTQNTHTHMHGRTHTFSELIRCSGILCVQLPDLLLTG